MEGFKIFSEVNSDDWGWGRRLEREYKDWLKKNPGIKIIKRKAFGVAGSGQIRVFHCVWYNEVTPAPKAKI